MSIVDEITKWGAILSPALALVPGVGPIMPIVNIVLAAVGDAEKPGVPGPQKLQKAVTDAADAINVYGSQRGQNFMSSDMMKAIEEMVNAGVHFANAVGAFQHAPKA